MPKLAKKPLPIHLGATERRILELLSERDSVSLAEAARRCIRGYELVLVPPPHEQQQGTSENAT